MEARRFVLFLVLSVVIWGGWIMMNRRQLLQQQAQQRLANKDKAKDGKKDAAKDAAKDAVKKDAAKDAAKDATKDGKKDAAEKDGKKGGANQPKIKPDKPLPKALPAKRVTLGSAATDSKFPFLITFNSLGGTIERVELTERTEKGRFHYADLGQANLVQTGKIRNHGGYIGFLGLTPLSDVVSVKAPTPKAEPKNDDKETSKDGPVQDQKDAAKKKEDKKKEEEKKPANKEVEGNKEPARGPPQGLLVTVVGHGTPAAQAGVLVGDILLKVGEVEVNKEKEVVDQLVQLESGAETTLTVQREKDGQTTTLEIPVTTTAFPLQLIQPESDSNGNSVLSYRLSLHSIDDFEAEDANTDPASADGTAIRDMRNANWETKIIDENTVEFRWTISDAELQPLGLTGPIELVKRYRVVPTTDESPEFNYHVEMEIELHNKSDSTRKLAYRMDGPNGLPVEGWWYANKIHPRRMRALGTRDVVAFFEGGDHAEFWGGPELMAQVRKSKGRLFEKEMTGEKAIQYVGVDTLYFNAITTPGTLEKPEIVEFESGLARTATEVDPAIYRKARQMRLGNLTYQLVSDTKTLAAGSGPHKQSFTVFLGPKQPKVLRRYNLEKTVVYGWDVFSAVARLMATLLHFFYGIVGNYGLAIIMLTVVVRGCMFPVSRKAASNAQMMQVLAPEMKKINEKYKNDLEKRSKAMRELYSKHNHNPLSGCLLMFIQLPIFIGLYKCLSVDIDLREAPLIAGMPWCSNLAGPDRLWNWEGIMFEMIGARDGLLGPYFNILPVATIALFILQQKMFTPPATDDATKQQQKIMKFMMIFFAFMFFKVPSGLCLYFIASSLWGIAERKYLPPPKKPEASDNPKNRPEPSASARKSRPQPPKKKKPKRR